MKAVLGMRLREEAALAARAGQMRRLMEIADAVQRMELVVERGLNEGRNLIPEATDDEATLIERVCALVLGRGA